MTDRTWRVFREVQGRTVIDEAERMDASGALNGGIGAANWSVVVVFLALVIGFAVIVKLRQRGTEDFFLAGRSMAWWIVMFSIFATVFSTISFVSVPGEGYKNGVIMWLLQPGALLFLPLGMFLFIRFFYYARVFSVYEYLEQRYNLPMRLYGSMTFIFGQTIYAGSVFFSAAKVFESLVGWDPMFTIVAVGIFTIAYSTAGGMKAVMLTDVVQGIIVIVGIVAIMFTLLKGAGFDVVAMFQHAEANDHGLKAVTEARFYRFNLHDRFSFWILILNSAIMGLATMSTNQSAIQRLLSAKTYQSAKRAIWGHILIVFPVSILLYGVGMGLFYYYGPGGGVLPDGLESDHVLGYFIRSELPLPLPGLITAALLAALMSTIDSTVNSQANIIHRDWLLRFGVVREESRYEMLICRFLSIGAGLLGVGFATLLYVLDQGSETTVLEIVMIVGGFAGGPMLYAFLFGVLSRRASGRAVFTSLLIGWAVNIPMPFLLYFNVPAEERIGFMWVSYPGTIVTVVLILILSFVWPNKKDLTNLTLWTLTEKRKARMKAGLAAIDDQTQDADVAVECDEEPQTAGVE